MSKNFLKNNTLYLTEIPVYASNIADTKGGLGGELNTPLESLEFWNITGKEIKVKNKICLELNEYNTYQFDRRNLIEYMREVRSEYILHASQDYKTFNRKIDAWKNVDLDGWNYRFKRIKETAFEMNFNLYMKVTKDSDPAKKPRYYISSQNEADTYHFIIGYCLIPKYTNIRIEKKVFKYGRAQYVFYLEKMGSNDIQQSIEEAYNKAVSKKYDKNIGELYENASKKKEKKPSAKQTITNVYERDLDVSVYVKKRAKGKCDLCGQDAPFLDNYGIPYLEEHHVDRLADGGDDTIDNAVALCPNCHRKMHILGTSEMKENLLRRLKYYSELESKLYEGNIDG